MGQPRWKVGLLGAGYIADWHVKALKALKKRTQLVAVCDVSKARAEAFAGRLGIAAFTDIDEWLKHAKPDAVHVLTPPEHHFAAAEKLLQAGVHVLLEKPACVTTDECDRLLAIAKDSSARVGVSHNFLYAPAYEKLRADVRAGMLGPLTEVDITWNKDLPQARFGPFGGFMFRQPGNIMLEIGPHSISHLLDLVGEPTDIQVECDRTITLPTGQAFHRRWLVRAKVGDTQVIMRFGMGGGFTEHRIHARGAIGTATADFDAGTYVLRRSRPLPDDFDRYSITKSEAKQLSKQSRGKLLRYGLSKFKLSKKGNDFGASILLGMDRFYAGLPDSPEERLSLPFARKTIEWGLRIGALAPVPPAFVVATPKPPASPKVLVLGGTGFIGQATLRKLVGAGHAVRALVRDPRNLPIALQALSLDIVKGDAGDAESMRKACEGIETVIHLARANVKTWTDYVAHEIDATRVVAEACVAAGVKRLLYTGTIDSFYSADADAVITDDTPLDEKIEKRNLYARAKAHSEQMLHEMARSRGLPVAIFRPGIVIGFGSSPFHWGVGMWNGGSVCRVWGQGDTRLPLVLVDDVADALVAAVTAEGIIGKNFNLVGPQLLTARDYLDELQKTAGVALDIRYTSPWKFLGGDAFKYVAKVAVRHPERRVPSFRDWDTRAHRSRYECANAKSLLDWSPTFERDVLVEKGIRVPTREWLA